jgi:hypothetical protein
MTFSVMMFDGVSTGFDKFRQVSMGYNKIQWVLISASGQTLDFGLNGAGYQIRPRWGKRFVCVCVENRELEHATHRHGSTGWHEHIVLGTNAQGATSVTKRNYAV